MNQPLISIQIPTYNQQAYIKDALESALTQTYTNLQIIIADDASPDYDIYTYLKDYQNNPKVTIHRNTSNLGRVGNYHYALNNLVQGTWFINLDGDDYFTDPNFVQRAMDAIQQVPNAVLYMADAATSTITSKNWPHSKIGTDTFVMDGIAYMERIDQGLGFKHAATIFNVAAAKKVNFYNYDILDVDFFSFLKIMHEGALIFHHLPVYHWRQHDAQATHTLNFDNVKTKYLALEDLKAIYADIPITTTQHFFTFMEEGLHYQLFFSFLKSKSWPNLQYMLKRWPTSFRYNKKIGKQTFFNIAYPIWKKIKK